MTNKAALQSPASKPASLASKASAIRRQIAAADKIDTGGSWRRRAAKARLLTRLRDEESRLRRRTRPEVDLDLPF